MDEALTRFIPGVIRLYAAIFAAALIYIMFCAVLVTVLYIIWRLLYAGYRYFKRFRFS